MSRKQDIYTEMLFWAIPYIRNVQTYSMFRKAFDKSCYAEADLVHNLQVSILESDFVAHDIHFLNVQARYYIESYTRHKSVCYGAQKKLISELFKLVPIEFQDKLEWQGPES